MKAFLLGLWQRLRGTPGSPARAATAVALGLFIGCQPLYGLHFVLVLAVCLPLRLDAVLAYLAANISNPLVAPFLIFCEVEAGAYLTTGRFAAFDVAQARATGALGFARQLFVGGLAVGAALALVGFGLAWLFAARRGAAPVEASLEDVAFEAAREANPNYGQARLLLGVMHLSAGEHEAAIKEFDAVLARDADHKSALMYRKLAEAQRARSERPDA